MCSNPNSGYYMGIFHINQLKKSVQTNNKQKRGQGRHILKANKVTWNNVMNERRKKTKTEGESKRTNIEGVTLLTKSVIFFKKMGQSRPLFLFIFVFSTCYNLNWKKHRWCAWESNPGRQDGRRERIHWATAAPPCWLFSSRLGNPKSFLIFVGKLD